MAVELLGGAEKIRRPIVIQCHTPAPGGRQNRAFLRLFSMIWPVPTKTRVRFPSPAPTISSAFSQFSRPLSFDCSVLPPRSVAFSGDSCPGIESEGSQWQMSFVCRWDHSSLLTPLFRLRIPEVPIPAWLLSVLGLATPGGFCRWRASLCPQSLLRFQSEGFGHGGFQSGDLVTGKDGVLRELALAF